MEVKLHHYQEIARQHIIDNPFCALFMQMGLGKSLTSLKAIEYLMYDSFDVRPGSVLIIAPLRVAQTVWSTEIRKWEIPLTYSKVLGSKKQRLKALDTKADIYIINRENVDWLVEYYGRKWPFQTVIIDELSSFKNPQSRRFRQLRKVRPLCHRVIGLTGTPAPNTLIDLWSQLYLLDRGKRLEKTLGDYRRKYFTPGASDGGYVVYNWLLRKGAEQQIHDAIGDICISMKSKDWLELPEETYNHIEIDLDKKTRATMAELQKDLVIELENDELITAETSASLSNKMLQMASGAVYIDPEGEVVDKKNRKVLYIHDHKVKMLEEILDTNTGSPVLVFYWHQHMLDRLKAKFPHGRVMDDGGDVVHEWNRGEIDLLFLNPASAGHGLNIQDGGHTIVWAEMQWSLELYQQANARLVRQGQKHHVIIHHLIAKGTIDEDVVKALETKDMSQDRLMEAVIRRLDLLAM